MLGYVYVHSYVRHIPQDVASYVCLIHKHEI